jgi:hypothetical protein
LSGPSGTLTFDYSLTGKSSLRTTIYQTLGPTELYFSTYVRTTGVTFSPTYQLTGKIGLSGTLAWYEQSYPGQQAVPGQPTPEFQYWNIGVNGVYQITRIVQLNGSIGYYWRTSNLQFGDYQA